jgi:plasmid stabilization system protein ParE
MREDIRLGNEALAQNDMETAKQHFQHLLDHGCTPIQKQIAENRLREIQAKQEALCQPPRAKPLRRRTREVKKVEDVHDL